MFALKYNVIHFVFTNICYSKFDYYSYAYLNSSTIYLLSKEKPCSLYATQQLHSGYQLRSICLVSRKQRGITRRNLCIT